MTRMYAPLLAASLLAAQPASAQEPKVHEESALAKLTQNPGAPLASVPFQYNFNGNVSPGDRTQLVLNVQPVLPVMFTEHISLVTRWIVPVLAQPESAPTGTTWGIGDINPELFLAGSWDNGLTLGAGVAMLLPTATDARLGSGKLGIGPALVGVVTKEAIVAGGLVTFVPSVAGDATRPPVRLLTVQPFVNLNLPKGTYLVMAPLMTFEFEGDEWTVPIGGGFGKIFMFGKTPTNASVQAYWNAAAPDGGPEWQFRLTLQFLFPQPGEIISPAKT